jgi:DNA-binding MarR family transcriptional regulator
MTRIVSGLELGGLARRIADSEDGRRVSVSATPKGIRLLQAARQRRIEILASQLKLLTDKELGLLQEAADLLDAVLSKRP